MISEYTGSKKYTGSKNLSCHENTPEFRSAIYISQNNRGQQGNFYTTLGHIVTKILDMGITFTLIDGTVYQPFKTAADVNSLLNISNKDYGIVPNVSTIDYSLVEGLEDIITEKNKESSRPQQDTMREFFQENVWGSVEDSDTINKLFLSIEELAQMGIDGINKTLLDDLKGVILEWTASYDMESWKNLSSEERDACLVGHTDKNAITEYFVSVVVDTPWFNSSLNPTNQLERIVEDIRSLYRVDPQLIRDMHGVSAGQFRNTQYV